MANNRMMLKCSICGATKVIGKYYPSCGWNFFSVPPEGVLLLEAKNKEELVEKLRSSLPAISDETIISPLNAWLSDHRHDDYSMNGPTHFTLTYESEEAS